MSSRPLAALAATAAAAALILLAGCGTTTVPDADETAPDVITAGDCATDETTTSTGPVSLTDSFGRTVELDAPAQRVAVLEWQQLEDVLTLCITPVAVADGAGYTLWDTAAELPDGIEDTGTRGEPNLDALYAQQPDLVIIEAYTADDEIIGQLEEYGVPVLATSGANAEDPIQNMVDTFELIAQATGREERAEVVVDEFEQHLADAKADLEAADPASTGFVYFDGWIEGGNIAIRPFGQGSLVGELGEELGLTNAWKGEVDPAYGLGQTDLEGMTTVGDAWLLYTGTDDPASDFVGELEKNGIWTSLPAVQDGRAAAFPAGIWTFGGPRSSQQIIDAYVALLAP
jgi:ferric hydroxamate transport system substrate-binding protein